LWKFRIRQGAGAVMLLSGVNAGVKTPVYETVSRENCNPEDCGMQEANVSLSGVLVVVPLVGVALAWASARAALTRHGRPEPGTRARLSGTLLSLLCSGAIAIVGAVPFYMLDVSSPPERGASFVFLIWIMFGPVVSFAVIPGIYLLLTRFNVKEPYRRFALPAVIAGSVAAAAVASWLFDETPPSLDDAMDGLVFIATVALT
jgi:hypothetical protein